MQIILASSSKYRAELLTKLGLKYICVSPNVEENRLRNETPIDLVCRLAEKKAREVAKTHNGIIIASDQIAVLDGEILTKSHTHKNAIKQLQKCSENRVSFLTSLTVLNTQSQQITTTYDTFLVLFKKLTPSEIENYLTKEQPYDCVGSFKSEGLGIALFEKIQGDDPNSLIGLPLIKLINILKIHNINVI